jgi:hypothetical protein
MRLNQPVADTMLWDSDDHLEKEGGKGQVRQSQGNTKTYLKHLFEDINGCSEYGRAMIINLRDDMLDRKIWRNTIRDVSTAQNNKHPTNNNNISTNSNTTTTVKKKKKDRQERESCTNN